MLKRLEIYGFKSFAEKTVLNFEDSINGIVGPNGSGKSNIVDAIKWCLGEQSLKEIRAKNPLDVIFAGSESKPPLNYCEVTITFDNQRGIFPIDYEEISITRKIYRNGETEYFINKAPCRLKDIKDLILDTGLASDGYSIIPQGKVEFVVSAKPEERRLLFEETAGISKYKVKREEALRKLERVKLDMARVEDILAYLKEQMASLEQAVKKAKNYQKYKQELQMLECINVIIQVQNIEEELKNVEELYIKLNSEYTSLATEITTKEAHLAELKTNIIETEKEFMRLKDEVASLETQISLTTQKIENYKNDLVKSEQDISKINEEIETLKTRNQTYSFQLEELKNKKENFKENISKLHNEKQAHQQEYDKYKSEISEKQEVVKQKNKLLTEISYKRAKLRNDLSSLTKELQNLHLEENSNKKDIEANKKDLLSTKQEIEQILSNLSELEAKSSCIKDIMSILTKEINTIEGQIKEKRDLLEEKNKEFYLLNSKLENVNSNFSLYGTNVNRIVKFLEEKNLANLCLPIKSILKISSDYYPLLFSYLGNKLFWFVVEKEEDAKKIIELIKENSLGFATFVIKEKIDKMYNEEIGYVDEKILTMINYEESFSKVIKFLFLNATFDGEEIKTDFVIHGGKENTNEKIEDFYSLEANLNSVSQEIIKIEDEIQILSKKYQENLEQKNLKEKELFSIEAQIKQLYQQKSQKEEYLSSLTELDKILNTNFEKLQQQISEVEKQIETLNSEIKNLDEEEKAIRKEIDEMIALISKLQSEKVVDEYLKISSEYVRIEEQYNNIITEIETKENLIKTNLEKISILEKEIEEITEYKEKIKQSILEEENNLDLFLKKREDLTKEINIVASKFEQQRTEIVQIEENIKSLLAQKEQLQQQINSIEIQKNTLLNSKSNYINWLQEKYSLSFEEAKEMYADSGIKEVDLQQIEKLKKRIDSMGSINLAAPEEYAQLEEKYNLLVTQQQDLIKAQQDLKDTIAKINQQISENFKETFSKVRDNFKNLCKILFEGGNADLILTNEDNILEAGIEIMVQPPGKKHQNINLLSGGEKSLVAIALLFSFFMVKPSPVCILDESDAQLDETNVVRFMKLLREFSKDTKFIVITHNTRTMEFLDTLYGITMEELGVSKVIAIRLQHAEVAV